MTRLAILLTFAALASNAGAEIPDQYTGHYAKGYEDGWAAMGVYASDRKLSREGYWVICNSQEIQHGIARYVYDGRETPLGPDSPEVKDYEKGFTQACLDRWNTR